MARTKTVGYTAVGLRRRWILTTVAVVVVMVAIGGAEYALLRLLGTGAPAATAPGGGTPARLRDGIPVPDRRSPPGAATAAINYQIAGFRVAAATLDATSATDHLLDPQASAAAQDVLRAPTRPRNELAQQRSSFAALSSAVQTYTPTRAVVLVWGVAAASSQITPQPAGTEDWGRSTVTLTWDGAQWRVTDQHYQEGPWPIPTDNRMATTDGDFSFRFTEIDPGWTYVPDA